MSELSKAYQPAEVEEKWYSRWLEADCFRGDEKSPDPAYSIVIPPPNVTGILHLGHVLNNTIQDILARRARQQGKAVLWLPGTDHAGIATQSKVEQKLRKEEKKTRRDLGRDAFLERVWDWKEQHGGIIISQLKRLGCSCDWSRERFTMDEEYSRWISKIFVDLFREGLIYRGKRMVNWCPKSLTALSDEEVIMKPQKSKLYYMRYAVVGEEGRYVEIATTRPETLMGDTGVAVNPKDERYADLVGKEVWRPFPKAKIPVVADEHIDPEFGTGVLKVTPAHDKADFEIGVKNNLEIVDVFNADGTLNEHAGEEFNGMDRFEARKAAAVKLEELGQLVKVEEYENNVGFSERADVPIEPRISMQWFMKYPCVEEATKAVADNEITFRPERWKKTYLHWMEGIQDWCISRQLWWGHKIPAWHNPKGMARLDEEVPVIEVTKTFSGAKAKELREQALAFVKDKGWQGSDLPNDDTGWEVGVRRKTIDHIFSNDGYHNIQAIAALDQLLASAKLVSSMNHQPPKGGIAAVHQFAAAARYEGALYRAKITVKETKDGHKFYDQILLEPKKEATDGKSVGPHLPEEKLGVHPSSVACVRLGDLFADVNLDPAFLRVQIDSPGPEWEQDSDVLDTWFSSWLWPFATMRNCDEESSPTLEKFYPTGDLVTGPDIIFFWVARMIMAGYRFEKRLPFTNVFFTSIVRDIKGRKMSKQLGNSPDVMDLMAQYGADGLRFALLRMAPVGQDIRFDEKQVEEGRNFANKFWNACRYRQMQGNVDSTPSEPSIYAIDILAKLDEFEQNLERAYASYKFNEIAQLLYDFVWSEFCDWYLESIKGDFSDDADPAQKAATLQTVDEVLRRVIRQLHPYMPHLTEELWEKLGFGAKDEFLMLQPLPKTSPLAGFEAKDVERSQERTKAIYQAVGRARNLKAEYNLGANKNVKLIVAPAEDWTSGEAEVFRLLSGAGEVAIDSDHQPEKGEPSAITDIGRIYMPLAGLIDVEAEKKRLGAELAKVEKEVTICERKLSNEKFVANAKPEVVAKERDRLENWNARKAQLEEMLAGLQ